VKIHSWTGLLAVAALTAVLGDAQGAEKKPNILLIVGDDMGYADIGVHGCKDIPTPNIDGLANSGVRCTNGYVSAPYCSPSRAGMLTGRYQTRFGHEFNPAGEFGSDGAPTGLPLSQKTMADRLKAAGYATGLVGKWHLGNSPEQVPQQRGFDEFFGFLGGAHSYLPGSRPKLLRGTERIDEKEYFTDAYGREAVDFIDRHQKEPFFLYLAFNAVHTPMEATPDRLEKFKDISDERRRAYAAMMSAMDDNIGKVLAKVHDAGLDENTLVFFISDNGGPTMRGTAQNGSNNSPLRGSKRSTLEGGIHVPFFVRWTGKLPAGKTYDHPVIQLDFLPTVLAAAGIEASPDWSLDGVDLAPYLSGQNESLPHEKLFWRFGRQMAIRDGDSKLVRYDPAVDGKYGPPKKLRMYDLAADIGESQDLSAGDASKVEALLGEWKAWNSKNVKPLWKQNFTQRKGGKAKGKAKQAAPAS
jgi:arylsulfatase A-like enzyme